MPNAFVVMPFKPTYEKIYTSIIRPCLKEIGFTVIRADEIQASSIISEDIEKSINNADLVIIEASEQNVNVYYEFGLATSRHKELIILSNNESRIPFDVRQWRHLLYDISKPDQFRETFISWLKRTAAYQKNNSSAAAELLDRGDIFPNIVDATLYIDTLNEPIDEKIWKNVKDGDLLHCSYSYYTDVGTDNWLRLCQDPLYTIFRESVNILSTNVDRVLDMLGKPFINSSPDFISLGPGNGQKDRLLLKGLVNRLINEGLAPELYYYPIDINPRMLTTAVKTISSDVELANRLKIKVTEGNFEEIAAFRPVFNFRPAPNLFSFLGNTLGNVSDEVILLNKIKNSMQPGDIMLLEVRLQTASMELGGDESHQLGLSFAPLHRLGVSYDDNKIKVNQFGSLSQVPGTKTVHVHYINAHIKGEFIEDITLSCVNYYDRNSLQKVLESAPLQFSIIDIIDTNSLAIFILQNN